MKGSWPVSLTGTLHEPHRALPCRRPAHKIASITISHHRLPLAPPFNASWDTKPRVHFDATVVRVSDRQRSHRGGLRGPDARLRRPRAPLHRHAIRWPWNGISACCPTSTSTTGAAGRWILPCGTSPARSWARPCWKLLGGLAARVRTYASSGTLRDPQAQADAARALSRAGFPGAQAALSPR